jgi:anti-sigma factor RsiW
MAPTLVCREVVALASAFLDGELGDETREAVEWHLFECRDCALYVGQLREIVRLARVRHVDDLALTDLVVEELVLTFARAAR